MIEIIDELKKKIDEYIGNTLINVSALFLRNRRSVDINKNLKNPKKILLIKFWGVGNIVMLTPSIKAIREKFPNSKIYFLTLSRNKGLLENLDYIDGVIYYKFGGLDIIKIISLISKYYRKFDIVIDFEQFINISSIISYLLGGYTLGFSNKTRARHKMYDFVKSYKNKNHMVEQFYGLCKDLGLQKKDLKLESFDFITKSNKVDNFLGRSNIIINEERKKTTLIGVHIGSSENAGVRRWPADYFAELVNILNERLENLIFVITGIESEKNDATAIIKKINKKNCYNSCGLFNLKDLIYFIKKCDLFISNDTGPIHIAAACGIVCVGFYGPNTPVLYGPYGKNHIIFYKNIKCSPCISNYNTKSTECKKSICMKKIKPNEVAERIINYIKDI